MRRTWLWSALLISVLAGLSAAWLEGHHIQTPPVITAKSAEKSLLRASRMPQVTSPVTVPGGYEAAAWDTTGRVTFWRWTTGTQAWGQVGASTYPMLPASFGTPNTKIVGGLLTEMTDATFIANGPFSGDGTGNFIAFTKGSHGWGTIAPGSGGMRIPTGNKSTDNTTPGISYTELFHDGHLEISEPGNLPFGPNGEEWQIGRAYAWSNGAFHQVATTQFTATLVTPLPTTAPSLPTSCGRTTSGTYESRAVSASTTFTHGSVSEPYLPASVVVHVQSSGSGNECDFTVTPDFPVVISATTTAGTAWITAPAWALTAGANGNQDIRNLLAGTQLPGQYGLGASEFQNREYSPYYIPDYLGISQIGQLGSAIIAIRKGQISELTILPS